MIDLPTRAEDLDGEGNLRVQRGLDNRRVETPHKDGARGTEAATEDLETDFGGQKQQWKWFGHVAWKVGPCQRIGRDAHARLLNQSLVSRCMRYILVDVKANRQVDKSVEVVVFAAVK
jgi:hypothetical protein